MHRLYVTYTIPDARGQIKKKQFQSLLPKAKLGAVYVADCYTIDSKLNKQQLEKAKQLLANPLTQQASTSLSQQAGTSPQVLGRKIMFSYAIEIGFLPGVTDNVGNTAKETLTDGARIKFKPGQNVYSSQVLFILGGLNRGQIQKIANSLYNPLIQKATITSFDEFQKHALVPAIPKVKLTTSAKVSKVDLNVSDDELTKLGKLGIPNKDGSKRGPLALSLDDLKVIRDYFNKLGRKPTDVELETLAQTWSEHCKHTIFADPMDELKNGIYKTYIKAATEAIRKQKRRVPSFRGDSSPKPPGDFCVSVFTDNSGAIEFNKEYLITHKVETHNTPSALDPFGGSVTGIVGVNRDCLGFGLGAKPIINVYGFCLADPEDKSKLYRDKELKQPMLSARRILDGVVSGINSGGNQSGIPTNMGFMYFNDGYRGKPLVFAGTVGLIPKKIKDKPSHIKQAKPGDLIVMVGGRVGLDGIHGATFSSETLDSHSPATAVQIGDPITQKKFSDALVKEARGQRLYSSITDCGAGGLSSAVGEMALATNGCLVNLEKVPLKYPGLSPWQIWISESQERMVLAVPRQKLAKLQKLMKKRGVETTVIGKFTNDKKCAVKFNSQTVLDLDLDFLHNGRPRKIQNTKYKIQDKKNVPKIPNKKNYNDHALKLLSSLNISGRDFLATQYDHEVQSTSVLKPIQGSGRITADATVTRPVLTSKKGVVLACGLWPEFSETDAYNMAACAIDTAIRNAVAAGADVDYLALLDNFCWSSSDDPHRLWQLKQAARACFDYATSFGTPFISGKDSMFNDFKGYRADGKPLKISIPPTLLISAMGVVPNANKTVSLDAKIPGDLIYILGDTNSEIIPTVDAAKNYKLYKTLFNAVQQDLIASSISVTRGGLVPALIKTLMGGGLGGEISLNDLPGNWKVNADALFSESQGRLIVTIAKKNREKFESLFFGQSIAALGTVTKKDKIIVKDKADKAIIDIKTSIALKTYKQKFKDY